MKILKRKTMMKESAQRYIVETKDIIFNFECIRDFCGGLYRYLIDGDGTWSSDEIWDIMKVMAFPDALRRLISDAHVRPASGMSVSDAYSYYGNSIIANMPAKNRNGILLTDISNMPQDKMLVEVRSLSSYLYNQIDDKLDQVANAILYTDKYIALRESLKLQNSKEAKLLLRKYFKEAKIPYIDVFNKTYPEYWD